jgi:hypothetical protein
MEDQAKAKKKRGKDEPVTLHPLDPKEALADLMKVKPEKEKRGESPRRLDSKPDRA